MFPSLPWEVSALPWLTATFENQKASGVDISLTEERAPPHLYGAVPVTPPHPLPPSSCLPSNFRDAPGVVQWKSDKIRGPTTLHPLLTPSNFGGGLCARMS